MEVTLNNRNALTGGAIIKKEDEEDKQKKVKHQGKDIWTDEEINIQAEERPDDRPEPEYDIINQQTVGTEDVFLGLSDKDPGSAHWESIMVKVKLPNTKFANVILDIIGPEKQILVVQAPNYYLKKILPYPAIKEKAKAKFDSDKCILSISLPVVKKTAFDELCGQ